MDRRTFLKTAGFGSVAFAAGCNAHPERHIYSLVRAPEDMVTGEAAWYASTCRECPAGCGVLAKNREGRVIKLEGNPLHPVNQGKLCARGQAALQGLYHPDRLLQPMLKTRSGWQSIPLDKAVALVQQRAFQAAAAGPNRVFMLTEVVGRNQLTLFEAVLAQHRAQGPHIFEPFAFESLQFAHHRMFGRYILPGYHLDQADLVVSFGADFLETWLSPVAYARQFKAMHAWRNGAKGIFVHIGPHQSLTAANADQWMMCRPGSEVVVALALIKALMDGGRGDGLPGGFRDGLGRLARDYALETAAQRAGVPVEALHRLARRLMAAGRPLVLPTETACNGPDAVAADLATLMLNAILDPTLGRLDFHRRHRVETALPRAAIHAFLERAAERPADLLLLNNVNPLYTMPNNPLLARALARKDLFKVAFARAMDETAAAADLIIPVQHPLEGWDAYESDQVIVSTLQPTVGKITDTPGIGDIFLRLWPPQSRPAQTYRDYLTRQLARQHRVGSEADWLRLIQRGGRFEADHPAAAPAMRSDEGPVRILAELLKKSEQVEKTAATIHVAPSLRFYDGRGADRPWLPEIPDPVSQVAWQTLAYVHGQTMTEKGWADGQVIEITTANGRLSLPAYAHPGVHPSLVVIPTGQGHTRSGRYARDKGRNPAVLLGDLSDPQTGAPAYGAAMTGMIPAGSRQKLATVSGSRTQHHRKIALSVALEAAATPEPGHGLTMADFPLTLPLPEGYDHARDLYPPHDHEGYRWGMVVDLDRCTGCSACVAGCYAENNVGVVGEARIVQGREMAWIRIERYQDPAVPARLIFLPMMCQHCDNAPCESVCPVYAPHHSKEGLNNQIYNRCIGTRFCAQNCPYKVRRFNWFDWQWPAPLNLQLNPDVTVRSKGVMEKCSFCIQRIKAAHNAAKNEQRDIRDGEVIPACVQTCPTGALTFGNLMDPGSAVRRNIADPRAYQVMGYLNTKPAVIYLKKVIQTL